MYEYCSRVGKVDRKHNMPNSPAFVAFPASLLFMALPCFLLLFWNPGSLADAAENSICIF